MPDSPQQPRPPDSDTTSVVRLSLEGDDFHESATGVAPSFRPPLSGPFPTEPVPFPAPGQCLGDFELLCVLGSGAFATVYLARDTSLDRQVALKVSANRGTEARTLASLEHDHIVHVFSEVVDRARNLRLLCMQYVSGTTLERVIAALRERPPERWSGAVILEVIDALSPHPALFDPAALRDRERLMACDFPEAVCWLGSRLAEALAHAHSQGVLHRDIKPANILLNRYGRPLLADFNVALDPQRVRGPAGEIFGGTLAYMAPEHIDAFNPALHVSPAVVDARSDIYALGLVLYELLTGRLPFAAAGDAEHTAELLDGLAAERRRAAPSPRQLADVPEVLDRAVRRCLDPRPEGRYQTADDLARALAGCGEHLRMMKELPAAGRLTRAVERRPILIGGLLMFLPHVLGSVVNITYNALRIVGNLTPEQQWVFTHLAIGYNLVVYPLCVWLVWQMVAPLYRGWQALAGPDVPAAERIAAVRQRLLRLPMWAVLLACAGWLPGGVFFPLGIDLLAGPMEEGVYGHFLFSFTISGLIALTYSVYALTFLSIRVLYPHFWVDAGDLRPRARAELRDQDRQLRLLQLLAGVIPLAGAGLLIAVRPEQQLTTAFRLLVTGLIFMGMFGFWVAVTASAQLGQALHALTGGETGAGRGP